MRKSKDEYLMAIIDEFVDGVYGYLDDIKERMRCVSFDSTDMQEVSDIAQELASFAEEQAEYFDKIVGEEREE